MKTLVWVEHDGVAVKDATLSAVTAASQLGEVHLLIAGHGLGDVAAAAAAIAGVGKVHVADDAAYAHALAENVAPLVAALQVRCRPSNGRQIKHPPLPPPDGCCAPHPSLGNRSILC